MFLALEEAPFVLQGPKPTIPPAAWESYWALGLIALGLIALGVVALPVDGVVVVPSGDDVVPSGGGVA